MVVLEELTSRIRGEYLEMPGLCLTFAQACRLWNLDATTCSAVLGTLVAQHFLLQTSDGAYVALPPVRPTPAKAALGEARPARTTRRSA